MKARFWRYPLFFVVGAAIALGFVFKPWYALGVLALFTGGYIWWVHRIYRRLAQRQQEVSAGIDSTDLQAHQLYYRRAQQQWEQGEYSGALGNFERAIADDHCPPEIYYQYGMLLLETGNPIDAMARLEQTVGLAYHHNDTTLHHQAMATIARLRKKFPQVN
jgi:tetratricopeptide (TPR) repeat protein